VWVHSPHFLCYNEMGDNMKNKVLNYVLTYGFIILLIVLLVDSFIKNNYLLSVILIIDIIIFLPIVKNILLKLIGKKNDWIVYIPRIIVTILILIFIPLTTKLVFYHTYISEDKKSIIKIDKYKIAITKDGKEKKYMYSYNIGENHEYFIEVEPEKNMAEQFMLLRYDDKQKDLCVIEDGLCTEQYKVKK